ncbi:hypothetical protein CN680_01215 [Bacillus pseudomycoides]|uniref:Uncharacterized protein n=1 Tax=Bacillus pseudomycoides TaxID=64104 RepID=A0A2C3VL90_9BACI|nr:hypothetical protein CON79_12765 [Bacillus pseudomycoides]PEA82540.1 hypothetical protein CON99_16730 [Bacillus pseudomycoides]PED71103.1 hypothetical protein CON97_16225 [Bacillus pseudomycoides]PEI37986.1 hypothetical protein CN620_21745 [Bacillus pseudomycoides]PEJ81815.1 hypothetical protein CN680_01215 [Bacillus pseudomycoides]
MYIFIGIVLLFISLVFLFAQRFAPNSAMMTSFKGNSLKKFIIGLVIASVLSLSYGFYHAATYSFKEAGNVTLTITENKTKRAETLIKIKE